MEQHSSNPFYTDEDDTNNGFYGKGGRGWDEGEEKRNRLQDQIFASEDRQIESSRRALASLAESESMGISTAEELLRQGEQLKNIERKTAVINDNMTTTQKHLNNIKSVFGGIKNWWNKGKTEQQTEESDVKPSRLQQTVEREKMSRPQHRNVDTSGFYDNDNDLDKKFMAGAKTSSSHNQQFFKPVTHSAREEQINENLGMMSDGLSRLKDLAVGLGDEIERQNDFIDDRIKPGIDRANLD
ncbi:hypothetical protein FSP39_000235 [Pinctada imbricata]|uniref:t-SNARE coiled-coil homology domain-containing protein n=1 Tax=Pinctada imbricata TaxID=66713 RepID=A0AA88XEL9_PINIB|nr:hypothetical protein FSP39_000235 [Pinctada imbricata]